MKKHCHETWVPSPWYLMIMSKIQNTLVKSISDLSYSACKFLHHLKKADFL